MNNKNLKIKKFNEYIEVLLEKDLSIVEILSDEKLKINFNNNNIILDSKDITYIKEMVDHLKDNKAPPLAIKACVMDFLQTLFYVESLTEEEARLYFKLSDNFEVH